MEAIDDSPDALTFNSPLETGLRALMVLEAMYPRALGLTELTWFDHIVVHTGDLDGPPSLHPDLPARTGELLVRRRLVERSLRLMQQAHLIDELHGEQGVLFVPSDDAPSFVELLQSPYSAALKTRAQWLAARFRDLSDGQISDVVSARIGRWTAEFTVVDETSWSDE